MTATVFEVDFRKIPDRTVRASGVVPASSRIAHRPVTPEGKLLTKKQIRARARRRVKRGAKGQKDILSEQEFQALYKPVEEWDLEELARGRPRNVDGNFIGRVPSWITRQVYEQAMGRFKNLVKEGMQANAVNALDTVEWILGNDEVDDKGKLVVPASTKLDAAKFLMEHVVGKPTQRIEGDISIKLQALLGVAMVNPAEALETAPGQPGPSFAPAHLPGVTLELGEVGDDDADILEAELVDS